MAAEEGNEEQRQDEGMPSLQEPLLGRTEKAANVKGKE